MIMNNPLSHLNKYDIILGSGSPRRQELMNGLGLEFSVVKSDVDEIIPEGMSPNQAPEYLAKLKAEHIVTKLEGDYLLITADTIVILQDQILGKPESLTQARTMIKALSGVAHTVITGVCIRDQHCEISFNESTEVQFSKFSDAEIEWFTEHYSIMDKAGAYGIQEGMGLAKIESMNGSYYNVMGLPTTILYNHLTEWK